MTEGELFNAKRDLDMLQKLSPVPNDTRPAIDTSAWLLVEGRRHALSAGRRPSQPIAGVAAPKRLAASMKKVVR